MKLITDIQGFLTPDLLSEKWKCQKHPLQGHCYVASEALYYLLPDRENYVPMVASYEGGTHWWLKNRKTGEILDVTAEQFDVPPYHLGRGCGFLTKVPSKRTKILLERIRNCK